MTSLNTLHRALRSNVKEHGSLILSGFAAFGVFGTAYLTGKASYKAANVIRESEDQNGYPTDSRERLKMRSKLVWKLYIPAGISATSTVICIISANRVETRKTIAAQSALAITQRVYSEYRDNVIEEFGKDKDQTIRDKMAEDRVKRNPPTPQDQLLLVGHGNVLCCELFTGRYFGADMSALKKAQNEINAKMLKHDYAVLDDLYYILGLNPTTESGHIGWNNGRLLELEFSSVLTDEGRPCLAFEYNYTVIL